MYEPLITPQHLQTIAEDDKMSPIEWFDDLTFESRSGDEWVEYGPANGMPYTIAFSRFYTYPEKNELLDWEWLPVNVISYEARKDSYFVEWHCNKQRKYVKRLNLLFEGENRDAFYKRIEKALKRRYFSDSRSKYMKTIDQHVDDDQVGVLPESLKFGVLAKVGKVSNKQLSILVFYLINVQDKCYQEMNQDYVFSMKQSIYERQDGSHILVEEDSSPSSVKFAQRALQVSGADEQDEHGELLHQVSVGARDLATTLFPANARFQRTTIQVLAVISSVLSDESGFFKRDFSFPVEFASFCERMNLANEVVSTRLSIDWIQAVAKIVSGNLDSLLDFDEANFKKFQQSRTHDFLRLVSLIMSTQLRTVTTKGIMSFLGLFNARVFPIDSKGTEHYKNGMISVEQTYTVVSPSIGLLPVLFNLPISIGEHGKMDTSPSLIDFEAKLERMLVSPIELTRNINRMEVILMKRLFTNPTEYKHISTLDPDVKFVQDARNVIFSLVRSCYPQIHSIIKIYEEFTLLITETLDEDMYDDLNAEVVIFHDPLSTYNSHLEKIKHTTFDIVRMPPFVIDCTQVILLFLRHRLN